MRSPDAFEGIPGGAQPFSAIAPLGASFVWIMGSEASVWDSSCDFKGNNYSQLGDGCGCSEVAVKKKKN